jgi:hypothetical protein
MRSPGGNMKNAKCALALCGVVLLVLLCTNQLPAQGFLGSISGEITDQCGAVVPNAIVKVTNVATNMTTVWKTNSAGV